MAEVSPGGRRSGPAPCGTARARAVSAELVVRQRRFQDHVMASPPSTT